MSPEEQSKLAQGKMLRHSLPVLLPIIEERQQAVMGTLIARFRAGETNLLTTVAELTVYEELKAELIGTAQETQHLEEKYNVRPK